RALGLVKESPGRSVTHRRRRTSSAFSPTLFATRSASRPLLTTWSNEASGVSSERLDSKTATVVTACGSVKTKWYMLVARTPAKRQAKGTTQLRRSVSRNRFNSMGAENYIGSGELVTISVGLYSGQGSDLATIGHGSTASL